MLKREYGERGYKNLVEAIITIFAMAIGYIAGYFARPRTVSPVNPAIKVDEVKKREQEELATAVHTLLNYDEAEAYNMTGGTST